MILIGMKFYMRIKIYNFAYIGASGGLGNKAVRWTGT